MSVFLDVYHRVEGYESENAETYKVLDNNIITAEPTKKAKHIVALIDTVVKKSGV